jgi:hypothetical protein
MPSSPGRWGWGTGVGLTTQIKGCFLDFPSYTSPIVLLVSPRFVYLIAGLCSLYMALVPLLSGAHGSTLFIGFWFGAVSLLLAAITPRGKRNIVLSVLALLGSALITALLCYQVARFGALRLGFARLVAWPYQPTTFDRVSQVLTKPVLIILPVSSVASLLISGITLCVQSRTNNGRTRGPGPLLC